MSGLDARAARRLRALLQDTSDARAELAASRASNDPRTCRPAQARLRRALEAYAAGLAELGAPVPHRLRTELQVLRCVSGSDSRT